MMQIDYAPAMRARLPLMLPLCRRLRLDYLRFFPMPVTFSPCRDSRRQRRSP